MPVKKCQINGESGYKWGDEGKCYTGPDAKTKAYEQGKAIGDLSLESYSDYGDDVKANAKNVLDWVDKNGWGPCGTPVGKQRANQLANGEPISLETIKRMYNYLNRHVGDLDSSKSYSDGCGKLMYDAWGGKSGLSWSRNKLKELGEIELEAMKISFDFDDTLSLKKWQDEAIRLISEGNILYIISARNNVSGMYDVADKVGIPHSRVYATGSNKAKIEKIKELGIDKHYDNNQDVINELKKLNISYIKAGEMAYERLSRVINFMK